jgi:hypothetical protein
MPHTVLFLITSDPRISHRPAEAIRIAAGVGVWKRSGITVYLRAAAVLALSEGTERLVDEENFTRYLPLVGDFGGPIYVQRGAPLLPKPGETPFNIEELDDGQLARLAANSTYVLRF